MVIYALNNVHATTFSKFDVDHVHKEKRRKTGFVLWNKKITKNIGNVSCIAGGTFVVKLQQFTLNVGNIRLKEVKIKCAAVDFFMNAQFC